MFVFYCISGSLYSLIISSYITWMSFGSARSALINLRFHSDLYIWRKYKHIIAIKDVEKIANLHTQLNISLFLGSSIGSGYFVGSNVSFTL